MMESRYCPNVCASSGCCQKRSIDQRQDNQDNASLDKDTMRTKKTRHNSSPLPKTLASINLSLHVRRTSLNGISRVARLPLDAITSIADLRGLFRRLIYGAFSQDSENLPDYLQGTDEFYMLSPREDFVSLPGDTHRTQFKLVASLDDGRQFVLAERCLGGAPDPERRFLVTVAEFESEPMAVENGNHVVVSLVAYPTVSVRREFLDEAIERLFLFETKKGGMVVEKEEEVHETAEDNTGKVVDCAVVDNNNECSCCHGTAAAIPPPLWFAHFDEGDECDDGEEFVRATTDNNNNNNDNNTIVGDDNDEDTDASALTYKSV